MMDVSKKTLQKESLDTDVLVVGAGAGGMMAAITASDGGANVILCELGNARRSGGLMGGNDHFFCWVPEIHGKEMREDFIREGRRSNYFMDWRLSTREFLCANTLPSPMECSIINYDSIYHDSIITVPDTDYCAKHVLSQPIESFLR